MLIMLLPSVLLVFVLTPSISGMEGTLPYGSQAHQTCSDRLHVRCVQFPSGSMAIVMAKAQAAVSFGNAANWAASPHGSKPRRVKALKTVSGLPTCSSPTTVKRNAL